MIEDDQGGTITVQSKARTTFIESVEQAVGFGGFAQASRVWQLC